MISQVQVTNIGQNSVIITWKTDAPADSQVEYGPSAGPPYQSTTARDPNMVINHSVTLTGLTANTIYHFRVNSRKSASCAVFYSSDTTFKTASAAKIEVWQGSTYIAPGSTFDFGAVQVGASVPRVFKVKNAGTDTLTVNKLISVPSGFTITSPLSSTQVTPGTYATFTVTMDTSDTGTPNGPVTIANSDVTNNPYAFKIQGAVTPIAEPHIQILLGSADVAMGSTVDLGSIMQNSAVGTGRQTFTIKNIGTADLAVSSYYFSGSPSIIPKLTTPFTLAPNATSTFTMELDPATPGDFVGRIWISNGDQIRTPYTFDVQGTVMSLSQPHMQVLDGGVDVPYGSTFDMGSTQSYSNLTKTLMIRNIGTADLSIGPTFTFDPGSKFSVSRYPTTNTLTPYSQWTNSPSTTFGLTVDTSAVGTYNGWVKIQNNDPFRNPFFLNLTADVTTSPNSKLQVLCGIAKVNSSDTVDLGTSPVGTPLTQTCTVKNIGAAYLVLQSINANNTVPSGFTLVQDFTQTSLAPNTFTTFKVKIDPASAGTWTWDQMKIGHSAPNAVSPFLLSFKGTFSGGGGSSSSGGGGSTQPKIEVSAGNTVLTNMSTTFTTHLGSTHQNDPSNEAFYTVKNIGNAALTLQPIELGNSAFKITLNYDQAKMTLQPGDSNTFHLGMDTTKAPNSYASTVTIKSNSVTSNPFVFNIDGTITPALKDGIQFQFLQGQIPKNNGGVNFGTYYVGDNIAGNSYITNVGNVNITVYPSTFQVIPGNFSAFTNNLPDTVLSPNQSMPVWMELPSSKTQTPGTLSDNVSFIWTSSLVPGNQSFGFTLTGSIVARPAPKIQVSVNNGGTSTILTNGGSYVAYGTTVQGATITKVYTVKNIGNANMNLSNLTIPSGPGFSVVPSGLSKTMLVPNDTATFSIRFDALYGGLNNGTVSLTSNDNENNPFVFYPYGTVLAPQIQLFDGPTEVLDSIGTVDLGSVAITKSAGRTLTLKNAGNASLTVGGINPSSPFDASVSASNSAAFAGATLAPNATKTFYLSFKPTVTGDASTSVNFTTNDMFHNPFGFTAKGKGTPPPAPHVTVTVDSNPLSNGGSLNFGSHVFGDTLSKLVTVANDGTAPLVISSITIPAGYYLSFNPTTIQPGDVHSWWLTFTAPDPAQDWNGFVTINHNAPNNPFTISVTGTSYCGVPSYDNSAMNAQCPGLGDCTLNNPNAPIYDDIALKPTPNGDGILQVASGSNWTLRWYFRNTGKASLQNVGVAKANVPNNLFQGGGSISWNPITWSQGQVSWGDFSIQMPATPGYYTVGGILQSPSYANGGSAPFGQIAGQCIKVQ